MDEDDGEVITPEVMGEDGDEDEETGPEIVGGNEDDEGAPVGAPAGEVAVPEDNGADGRPTPLFVSVVVGQTFKVEVNDEVMEPDMTVSLVTTVLLAETDLDVDEEPLDVDEEPLDVVLVVVTFVMVNSSLRSPESPNTTNEMGESRGSREEMRNKKRTDENVRIPGDNVRYRDIHCTRCDVEPGRQRSG